MSVSVRKTNIFSERALMDAFTPEDYIGAHFLPTSRSNFTQYWTNSKTFCPH